MTGANQGLGRALVHGLAAGLGPADRILLTGRDPDRVRAAAAAVPDTGARVEGRVLDVRDRGAITALAAELGEIDIVFSNATSRMSPDEDPADQVDAVAETNNLAAITVLRAFAPRLRPGGRLIIVASAWARWTSWTSGSARGSPPRRRTSTRSRSWWASGGRPCTPGGPSGRASAAG